MWGSSVVVGKAAVGRQVTCAVVCGLDGLCDLGGRVVVVKPVQRLCCEGVWRDADRA